MKGGRIVGYRLDMSFNEPCLYPGYRRMVMLSATARIQYQDVRAMMQRSS